jgi:predicted glycoside hydrolase/deacetylase ChbG (UPF0249 family)
MNGMDARRSLILMADDFGIGPATSSGILQLASEGAITGTALLVNSPHAWAAIQDWRRVGIPLEVGWHPCLTMDRPISPPGEVPTLIDAEGRFWSLGRFLCRLATGRLAAREVANEMGAQLDRFIELVGYPPTVVGAHHHLHIFRPIGRILIELLARRRLRPYVRRVQEPWRALARVPTARFKRVLLTSLGRSSAREQARGGLPGNDWLGNLSVPTIEPDFDALSSRLGRLPGDVIELVCHPGHLDPTLVGRDCSGEDPRMEARVREYRALRQPEFRQACERAGFALVSPSRAVAARIMGRTASIGMMTGFHGRTFEEVV